MAKQYANLLRIEGTAAKIRKFKRIVYESQEIPVSFRNALITYYADDLYHKEEQIVNAFGNSSGPRNVKIIKETNREITYFFMSSDSVPGYLLYDGFPDLDIFLTSLRTSNLIDENQKNVKRGGITDFLTEALLKMAEKYPGIKDDDIEYTRQKGMNEIEADSYLKKLSESRKKRDRKSSDKEMITGERTPFSPYYFRKYKDKEALLIISYWEFEIEEIPKGYDLVIYNFLYSLELYSECLTYDGVIYERIKPGIIKISGADTKLTAQILKKYGIKVKCVARGMGFSDISTHVSHLIERISPILTDQSYFIVNEPPEDDPEYLPMINGLPNQHFDIEIADPEEAPFITKIFPAQWFNERFMNKWKAKLPTELNYPQHPGNPSPLFKLHRRAPDHEVFRIGKTLIILSNASLWDYEERFDCLILNFNSVDETSKVFRHNQERTYIMNKNWFLDHDYSLFIREANLERWGAIGIGCTLTMDLNKFIDALKRNRRKYPSTIHFFVMNRDLKQETSKMLNKLIKNEV